MTNKTIERAKEKAAISYKVKKSFIGRNYYLFYGVVLVYIAASLWSMTTAAGNIYLRVAAMLGENVWAIIAAVVGGVSIVGLQFVSGKGAVDDLQIGILKTAPDGEALHSLGDRVFFFLKAAGFIAATAVSITLSLDGVGTANDYFRNEKRPFQDLTASVEFYDNQIAALNTSIAQEQTRKWKGVLTTDASRRIAKYEAKKKKLINQRADDLAKVAAVNTKRKAEYDAKTASNEKALTGVGGVAEVVIIFCVIFIGLYDDGLYREAGVKKGAQVAAPAGMGFQRSTPPVMAQEEQQRPTAYGNTMLPIGFQTSRQLMGEMRQQIRATNTGQQNKPESLVNVAPGQQKRATTGQQKSSPEMDKLRRQIAEYRRRNDRGELGAKGQQTLKMLIAKQAKMKGNKTATK